MIVDPKSGWRISRKATAPVTRADSANTGSDLSVSRSDSSQAIATTKKGFRNSDGWNCVKPTPIQRFAPLISGPISGTKIISTKKKAAPNSDSLRALSRGSIEMPIITGMPSAIHASWR